MSTSPSTLISFYLSPWTLLRSRLTATPVFPLRRSFTPHSSSWSVKRLSRPMIMKRSFLWRNCSAECSRLFLSSAPIQIPLSRDFSSLSSLRWFTGLPRNENVGVWKRTACSRSFWILYARMKTCQGSRMLPDTSRSSWFGQSSSQDPVLRISTLKLFCLGESYLLM